MPQTLPHSPPSNLNKTAQHGTLFALHALCRMRAINHPLATVLFMGTSPKSLTRAVRAELEAGRTVMLAGQHLAAIRSPEGFVGLYRWSDDVIHSYDYTEEEQFAREVFSVGGAAPKEPKTLACTREAFPGTVLALLHGTRQSAAIGPVPYPYIPPEVPAGRLSLRSWCSPGPIQAGQERRSGQISIQPVLALTSTLSFQRV